MLDKIRRGVRATTCGTQLNYLWRNTHLWWSTASARQRHTRPTRPVQINNTRVMVVADGCKPATYSSLYEAPHLRSQLFEPYGSLDEHPVLSLTKPDEPAATLTTWKTMSAVGGVRA
jgi:hypothetical protein